MEKKPTKTKTKLGLGCHQKQGNTVFSLFQVVQSRKEALGGERRRRKRERGSRHRAHEKKYSHLRNTWPCAYLRKKVLPSKESKCLMSIETGKTIFLCSLKFKKQMEDKNQTNIMNWAFYLAFPELGKDVLVRLAFLKGFSKLHFFSEHLLSLSLFQEGHLTNPETPLA